MDNISEQLYPMNEPGVFVKAEFYYNIGGMNYLTGRVEKRGYYISVYPVKREQKDGYVTETSSAYTGVKQCLHECKRRSKNAEKAASEKLGVVLFVETHSAYAQSYDL